ncbi:EAL domain-containing protein [Desulfosediminicola ganghwensis]|uniref:EAL domain-containing protein n=1 Tax=Desulfosediminicola ganghwensis TaxID=2569540 RepID=UPI0010AD444A|nr:EAL domain-containing protein [Desulfosediminicola ganghwensis]
MGHTLGVKMLAEGVEILEQLNLVHDMGVDEAQGYVFAKPVSARKFLEMLKTWGNESSVLKMCGARTQPIIAFCGKSRYVHFPAYFYCILQKMNPPDMIMWHCLILYPCLELR